MLRILEIGPPDGLGSNDADLPHARVVIARNRTLDDSRPYQRTACRYLLQQLLSGIHPDGWSLAYTGAGAPRLQYDGQPSPLRVSLAHSGRLLAVGVARNARIGLDVERIRPRKAVAEMATYLGWQGGRDLHAFLARWTVWEACAKLASSSILATSNPGFEALNGISRMGGLVTTGRWSLFQDLLHDEAFFSIVLNPRTSCPLSHRYLVNHATPW